MKFVNKLVLQKKNSVKLQNSVNQIPRNFGNMLILSLNHKLELVILRLLPVRDV